MEYVVIELSISSWFTTLIGNNGFLVIHKTFFILISQFLLYLHSLAFIFGFLKCWDKCKWFLLPLWGMSSNETRSIIVVEGQGVTDAPIMADGVDCNAKIFAIIFKHFNKKKLL